MNYISRDSFVFPSYLICLAKSLSNWVEGNFSDISFWSKTFQQYLAIKIVYFQGHIQLLQVLFPWPSSFQCPLSQSWAGASPMEALAGLEWKLCREGRLLPFFHLLLPFLPVPHTHTPCQEQVWGKEADWRMVVGAGSKSMALSLGHAAGRALENLPQKA